MNIELSGRELDAAIGVILGWRWYKCLPRELHALYAPDDGKWVRWNFRSTFQLVDVVPPLSERFEDWDRLSSPLIDSTDSNRCRCLSHLPHCSTDANAALAAYEVMRQRGWWMIYCEDGELQFDFTRLWTVTLKHRGVPADPLGIGDTFPEALSLAIVAAHQEEQKHG